MNFVFRKLLFQRQCFGFSVTRTQRIADANIPINYTYCLKSKTSSHFQNFIVLGK